MFFWTLHTVSFDFIKHNEDIQFTNTKSGGGCGDLAQLVESCPPMHKLGSIPSTTLLGRMEHTCNPLTWAQCDCHAYVYDNSKTSLSYMKCCL